MSELGAIEAGFNVSAFLPRAIEEGMSARRALASFREAGGRMGNQAFRSLYGEARAAVEGRDAIAGLDYDAIPPGTAYTDWTAGAEGRYATFVQSFTRMPGEVEVENRFYTHITDAPHSPQEAIDAAAEFYTDAAVSTGGTPQGVYQGSVVTSMTRTKTAG